MFRNYFKIALRNLLKYKGYSFINIAGLAIGIASCVLIFLFVMDELSHDRFHLNSNRIARVNVDMIAGGNTSPLAVSSFPMGPALKKDYPEIQAFTRIAKWGNPLVQYEEKRFYENNFFWADTSVFDIFSYQMISGDPKTALKAPNSVVLTRETAERYFGSEDPIGKTFHYDNQRDLQVTGVIENLPENLSIQFDFLGSFPTLEEIATPGNVASWHSFFLIYTFLLFPEQHEINDFNEKMPAFVDSYMHDDVARSIGRTYTVSVTPLENIYLQSKRIAEAKTGDINYVYTFTVIAIFVLLIACINFMNLSTARSIRRSREVGMRKVLGARRGQLIRQFLGESLLLSIIALPLAFLIVELSLPFFNTLSGKALTVSYFERWDTLLGICGFVLLTGIVAGSYPAFYLSGFKPIATLKSNLNKQRSIFGVNLVTRLRRALVVLQFGISIVLVIGTMLVYNQLEFMRNKKLGFDKEQVIVIPATDAEVRSKFEVLRTSYLQNPDVSMVSGTAIMPGTGGGLATPVTKAGGDESERWEMTTLPIGPQFLQTLGVKLVAGRFYSEEMSTDTLQSYIINAKAAALFGWVDPEDAIGQQIEWFGTAQGLTGTVIGVTDNFHISSLHNEVQAVFMIPMNLWPSGLNFINVRSHPNNMARTLDFLKQEWQATFPLIPFRYSFLDENFAGLYQSEEVLGQLFGIFGSLAILIACLGLFGLASFTAEQRTREIGVRKVLGATLGDIILLLTREFLLLIALANLIAWPVAYWIMDSWLQNFAYRDAISLTIFPTVAIAAFLIALLTVGYQAIRAATADPVDALRYE